MRGVEAWDPILSIMGFSKNGFPVRPSSTVVYTQGKLECKNNDLYVVAMIVPNLLTQLRNAHYVKNLLRYFLVNYNSMILIQYKLHTFILFITC